MFLLYYLLKHDFADDVIEKSDSSSEHHLE